MKRQMTREESVKQGLMLSEEDVIDGTIANERIVNSSYDSSFTYEVGKTVEVQDFDTNRWEECTRGIHFFINRQEAINY